MNVMVNYLAVVVAAVAGFLLGWGWYMAFGKGRMLSAGRRATASRRRSPSFSPASALF